MTSRRLRCATLLCAGAFALHGTARAEPANLPVSLPVVTPVPPGAPGHPLDAAANQVVPFNLAASGYTEQEYFVSGTSRIYAYENDANPGDSNVEILRTNPYVDRILVRKPANPANFSGNVVVELFNDALSGDVPTTWAEIYQQIVRNGDAWVGITNTPIAINALKTFNPVRYASLSFASTSTGSSAECPLGGQSTELGVIYDIVTQLGMVLRTGGATSPLAGYNVKALLLDGYSLGALELSTYMNAILPTLAASPFDGYMLGSGAFPYLINSCANYATDVLRAFVPAPLRQPIMQTQTLSETELYSFPPLLPLLQLPVPLPTIAPFPHRADSDAANNRYRFYEIAGTAHATQTLLNSVPDNADVTAATGASISSVVGGCNLPGEFTTFPDKYPYDAIWANFEAWVRNGTPPPHASAFGLTTDLFGNQLGGLRSPAVDVPVKSYKPGWVYTPLSAGGTVLIPCLLFGYDNPLGSLTLHLLYSTHAGYVNAVTADVNKLAAQGFLTAPDAAEIIQASKQAAIP